MPKKTWTNEMVATLREKYLTVGPTQLAIEMGLPYFAVVAKSRRLGIGITRKAPPKDFVWTDEMIAAIKARYVEEGGDELAKEFNVSLGTLRRVAAEHDLHTIAGHKRAGKEKAENNTSSDIHFFDEWSDDMAYILGFLFADGSINQHQNAVTIGLNAKDRCVLEFIREEMKVASTIKEIDAHDSVCQGRILHGGPAVSLTVSSTVMVRRLMELGMMPRKTYRDDPFPEIPTAFLPHFTRGMLDGDGSVSTSDDDVCSVNFVGPVRFITGLRNALIEAVGVNPVSIQVRRDRATEIAYVTWSSAANIVALYKYLYPEGFSFCLERKRQRFMRWLANPHIRKTPRPWTVDDEDQIRNLYGVIGPAKLARLLDRTCNSLRDKARKMGLQKPRKKRN